MSGSVRYSHKPGGNNKENDDTWYSGIDNLCKILESTKYKKGGKRYEPVIGKEIEVTHMPKKNY